MYAALNDRMFVDNKLEGMLPRAVSVHLRRSRYMRRGRRKTMNTSVKISSVGNMYAYGSTDRLDRKTTTLCICKTLEM